MVLVHAADVFREKASRPHEWTAEVVTAYSDFLRLETAWNDLVARAHLDHPFLTHEWVRTWWDSFGADKKLHIVLVTARDEIVGIAPLMLTETRMYGLRMRQLGFIFNVHTPRMDVVVGRARRDVYRVLWRYLAGRSDVWDVLALHQLPDDSTTLTDLVAAAQSDGHPVGLWPSDAAPYLTLAGTTADAYFAGLGSKHKSNMRNRSKRLGKLGDVQVETIDGFEGLDAALADGFRIEAAAWKGAAHTAIQCNEQLSTFYTRLGRLAAQKKWLRLHFLSVGGRRIAFGYSLVYANKFYLLKAGYDPEYSAYSPFNLLCERILRTSFEEGLQEFDFLGAAADWKLKWASATRPHSWLYVFGRDARARLVHWMKFRLASAMRERPLMRRTAEWLRTRRALVSGLFASPLPGPEKEPV